MRETKITTFIRKENIPRPGFCTGKEAFHLYLTVPFQWASPQPFRILLCSAPFPLEFSHKPAFSVYCVCESLHPLHILLSTPYKLSSKPSIIVYLGLWIYIMLQKNNYIAKRHPMANAELII